ncbi:TPA: AAA family ATPase [Klebsiella pneumoniae]|jgi:predicted ATP-binding protein involved in virulence|uniref:AAA family ATPase n=1 Tax=Klebsiella pneumoniae TaxID=573 RepID=UPI00191B405A|nr:AAA family ATPase [Klebsiella pneumoniae]HBQ8810036.1 AAA family ATPase [Klebsiella pneumoniae]
MEKIRRFEIDGLFNRFNYSIDMSIGELPGLSIISAPNGYGKTTILKMIASFSTGDFLIFFKEKYKAVRFFLTSDEYIEITRGVDESDDTYISLSNGVETSKITNPLSDNGFVNIVNVIDKYLPYLRRVGPRKWRDDRVGDIISLQMALSRYKSHPALKRTMRKRDVWVDKIISTLNVFTISTNRLSSDERLILRDDSEKNLMVVNIAENIKDKINEAIRNQFEDGRKKETSFPTRIIEALSNQSFPSKESVLVDINKLKKLEDKYSRLGLIPNTETTNQFNTHIKGNSANGAGLLVLKTYLEDVLEKFALLDDLAEKLDIFTSSINSLLSFKEVMTTIDDGFVVKLIDGDETPLDLESLSSGEQHLLVLIGRLIFETSKECMVLIDEPEISFHPEWQERFIGILSEIRKMNGFDVVLATHSPVLIGDLYWDYVVELSDQYSPSEKVLVSDIDISLGE